MQTNPLHFLNYQLYFKTPVLVAVAIFCWLVPIATFYPPGTLIVGIQPSSIHTSFNVSVLHYKHLKDSIGDPGPSGFQCDYEKPDRQAADNKPILETCRLRPRWISDINDIDEIARSNLIVGEISRLEQASKENSSYELDFFGTTLDCETTNHSMESTILQIKTSNFYREEYGWEIKYPEPTVILKNEMMLYNLSLENSSITYRLSHVQDTPQYWPCLDRNTWMPRIDDTIDDLGWIKDQWFDFPGSGIHVIVPVTETVCHPKIVKYRATISNVGGAQHVSFATKDEAIPLFSEYFADSNGTIDEWIQLSDAITTYQSFAFNLNRTGTHYETQVFPYPSMSEEMELYTTENDTVVETCVLEGKNLQSFRVTDDSDSIWPLSVFQRRLRIEGGPGFDPDMANELLINTTISSLALNKRFDMVNGTETRGFNAYRFENKLALILPYGLSLVLAVPILVLGFVALYVQNHGVSAMSGGFLQLLMTTTGRTSLEAVVTKGSGTLGGYENVSEELREMEVRFGELIEVSGDDLKETDTLLSGHEEHADVQEGDRSQSGIETMSGTERCEKSVLVVQRAGFGTVDEVGLFRKKEE